MFYFYFYHIELLLEKELIKMFKKCFKELLSYLL